LYKLSH